MAVIVIVIAAAWFTLQSPLFAVDSVTVEGNTRTSTGDVAMVSGISPGDPLISVRQDAVRERLSSLPWIAGVDVNVGWSGTVHIRVSERAAVAVVVTDAGEALLVDDTGRILGPMDSTSEELSSDGLVRIEGLTVEAPDSREPNQVAGLRSQEALLVATNLGSGVKTRVAAVVVAADGLELRLVPDGTVLLGSSDDLTAKLRSLTTVLAQVDLDDLETIDIRVPDQPVVTRTTMTVEPATGSTTGSTTGSMTGSNND